MQAIELDTVINEMREIHLALPQSISPGAARVIAVIPDNEPKKPSWQRPGPRLHTDGMTLSAAILAEREEGV